MVSPVDLIKFKDKHSNKEGSVNGIALGSNHSVAHVTFWDFRNMFDILNF